MLSAMIVNCFLNCRKKEELVLNSQGYNVFGCGVHKLWAKIDNIEVSFSKLFIKIFNYASDNSS